MGRFSRLYVAVVVALVIAACAPSPPSRQAGGSGAAPPAPQQTLVISVRGEPPTLADKPLVGVSGALRDPVLPFNAELDGKDDLGQPFPYLAEALPQADTDTWRVFPDGRMETTYRLKPNLTWHDGTPLSSEDFVFSWRVYATPEMGTSKSPPIGAIQEVVALDPRSFVIRWRELFADAAELADGFPALPRHILQGDFEKVDPFEFPSLPYWSTEYVGLGSYRLIGWEPGAFLEAEAFDGHALGRPKIDRLKVLFIPDPNTALANLLAGTVHYVGRFVLGSDHAAILEQEWASSQGGSILYSPTLLYTSVIQLRPELADPPALLDLRVRRALAHGMDRSTANEVLNAGKGILADTYTSPLVPYYGQIERVIRTYPHDPQRAQQLMAEVGFTKGRDGLFVGKDGSLFQVEMWISSGAKNERQIAALADSLKGSGFSVKPHVIPAAAHRDAEGRATAPGLSIRGGGASIRGLRNFTSAQAAGPENRWTGQNYGGWVSPTYDRVFAAFSQAIEPSRRVAHVAEMNRLLTEELPAIFHWWEPNTTAHAAAVKGPKPSQTPDGSVEVASIHQWEWRP